MKPKRKLIILGVGQNTAVYVDLAELLEYEIVDLYHYRQDRVGQDYCGCRILGCHDELLQSDDLSAWSFALSMGENSIRTRLADQVRKRGGSTPRMIHPSATVSRFASVDDGVMVGSHSTVQANVRIGKDAVISFNAGITHDADVEAGVYVAAGSLIGASTHVHRGALVGMGSTVISHKVKIVGENSIIGAGSVVVEDVEPFTVVAGNPARLTRHIDPGSVGSSIDQTIR